MRLQMLDTTARFSCGQCTACCDQPWRTLIEAEKTSALDAHDFGAYPQLAGKRFYRAPADGRKGFFELAKGEGTRCIFLDADGLCIIHKELGPQAKPNMCLQFPFLPARTWQEDRVSVNYGCSSVQQRTGRSLSEQALDIAAVVPVSNRPARPDAPVPLDAGLRLTRDESDALFDRAIDCFDDRHAEEIWTPFAGLLATLTSVQASKRNAGTHESSGDLIERLRSDAPLPGAEAAAEIRGFVNPAAAPMPARFLFAATLYPDTMPADVAAGLGFWKRLALIPRLLNLATLSGGYASRLLGRNVSIGAVLAHPVEETMDPGATALLLRYYRSRLWQRMIAGTRLPIVGGIHQHIHDLNAILFLARAEAAAEGVSRLGEDLISTALRRVEFHLANQVRLHERILRGWLRTQLCDLGLAGQSLRLMSLKRPAPVADAAEAPADCRK